QQFVEGRYGALPPRRQNSASFLLSDPATFLFPYAGRQKGGDCPKKLKRILRMSGTLGLEGYLLAARVREVEWPPACFALFLRVSGQLRCSTVSQASMPSSCSPPF
ncbi:MAG: hypothetical protein MN733_24385, partial [Nitrososphaera sp.]|nr:hypothetical protein [Nitrososphaera sp.]